MIPAPIAGYYGPIAAGPNGQYYLVNDQVLNQALTPIGSSRRGYQMLRLPIEFLRPIPSVALIPLAVLVFGTRFPNKLFLVTFACVWPLLFQAIYGVQDVDPVAVDTARAFGFGRFRRLVLIVLPSSAPYIATGLRIASSVALILAVTSELVVGVPGLGSAINVAATPSSCG